MAVRVYLLNFIRTYHQKSDHEEPIGFYGKFRDRLAFH